MELNNKERELSTAGEDYARERENIEQRDYNRNDSEAVRERETVGGDDDVDGVKSPASKRQKRDNDKNDRHDGGGSSSGGAGSAGGGAGAAGGVGAAAAVVAIVVVAGSGLFGNVNAKFLSLDPAGSNVSYSIQTQFEYTVPKESEGSEEKTAESQQPLIDFENIDTGLRLLIYGGDYQEAVALDTRELEHTVKTKPKNNGTKYDVTIVFYGKAEGMQQKQQYTFEVIGSDNGKQKSYIKKTVKTTGPVSEFRSIAYLCQCSVDGNFYFDLDYDDDNGYYSDFSYSFIPKTPGVTTSLEGRIEDPKKRQAVDVLSLRGQQYKLTITYHTADPDDTNRGVAEVSREFDVEI